MAWAEALQLNSQIFFHTNCFKALANEEVCCVDLANESGIGFVLRYSLYLSGLSVFFKHCFLSDTVVVFLNYLFFLPLNKRQKLEFCDNHMTPAAGTLGSGVRDLIHLCMVIFMGTVFMASTQSLIK